MTEVLVQQEGEPKREATTERLATADNRENRKGQAHRLGGEVEVSDRIYRCCSCSLSLHSLFVSAASFLSSFFFLCALTTLKKHTSTCTAQTAQYFSINPLQSCSCDAALLCFCGKNSPSFVDLALNLWMKKMCSYSTTVT